MQTGLSMARTDPQAGRAPPVFTRLTLLGALAGRYDSPDNEGAERFHRDSLASSQQPYLRSVGRTNPFFSAKYV
jgi:hypothetical protein